MSRASGDAPWSASIELNEILRGSPRSSMAKIANRAESLQQMQKFEALGSRASFMRSCDLSPRSGASGNRCLGNSYELSGQRHCPPTEEAVLAWSAYYAAGRTSQIYLPRLAKARISPGRAPRLNTRAAAQAAKGLARTGDRVREPKPAVSGALLFKIASRRPLADPLAQAIWVSWAFLSRAQSERFQLARQLPPGKMDPDSVSEPPAAIGMEKGLLVIKLRRRKRTAGGSGMARRRICHCYPDGPPEIHAPQLFCPACSFREIARTRAGAGEELFPGVTGPDFANRLRSTARQFGWTRPIA